MQTRQLTFDFNVELLRYQQNKGLSLEIEYSLVQPHKEDKWGQLPTQIDWQYIARNGK